MKKKKIFWNAIFIEIQTKLMLPQSVSIKYDEDCNPMAVHLWISLLRIYGHILVNGLHSIYAFNPLVDMIEEFTIRKMWTFKDDHLTA